MGNVNWQNANDKLGYSKRDKTYILKQRCHKHIVESLYYTYNDKDYRVPYDEETQLNFQDIYNLMTNEAISETTINAYLDDTRVRLTLDSKDFLDLYEKAVIHKRNSLSYLNDTLLPKVDSAGSPDELTVIEWSTNN